MALLSAAFFATILLWEERRLEVAADRLPAIVTRDGAHLRTGNGPSYPDRVTTPLARGAEAVVLFRRGDWCQIELPTGEVGWLAKPELLVAVP